MISSEVVLSFREYRLLKKIYKNPNSELVLSEPLNRLLTHKLIFNSNPPKYDPCSGKFIAKFPMYKISEDGVMALRTWLKDKIRFHLPLLLSILALIISAIALWRSW